MQQLAPFQGHRATPPLFTPAQGERRTLDSAASRVVTFAYEMALGRAGWDDILDALAQALPNCLISLSADELAGQRNLALLQRGPGSIPGARVALVGDAPLFEIYHSDQVLPPASPKARSAHRDLSATGTVIARNGSRQLTIEARYLADNEVRNRVSALLRYVTPHLGRAVELTRRASSVETDEFEDVVRTLPFGLFLVDRNMRVHYANGRADELRRANAGPFIAFDGMLRASDEAADRQLRELVARAGHGSHGGSAALRLGDGDASARYFVTARQANAKPRRLQLHDALYDAGPLILVALHTTEQDPALPVDLLWRSFALSDAEARLAEALVNGLTLAEFAKEREVSKQTLRNQLVGLMRKTGTRRQSELVSMLTRLSLAAL